MLFCSSLLTAQTNKNTSLLEESISIKLAKFPIADFPNKSVPVSDIRIAQMVRDSVNLGYALKGMDNYVVNLKITKPLTDFLQDHIYRMYEDDFKKDGIKMFWVLKDLRMERKPHLWSILIAALIWMDIFLLMEYYIKKSVRLIPCM